MSQTKFVLNFKEDDCLGEDNLGKCKIAILSSLSESSHIIADGFLFGIDLLATAELPSKAEAHELCDRLRVAELG